MSSFTPSGARRWYRSLYWRIAAGFIAFLAMTLVAQGGFFLWLSTQREEALPPRLLADLASLVAEDLGDAVARTPGLDLPALARERFGELGRPAALLLRDGRVVASDAAPPPPLVADVRRQFEAGEQWRERRPRGGRARDGQMARGGGRGGVARPFGGRPGGLPSWAVAPVSVDGRVVAAVMVARGRPPGAVARELAPWVAAGFAALLLAGTALASLAVFRPAQNRLRNLEDAARRFGAGDLGARALEAGGDEVAAVARAFNRMAREAAAREAVLVDADRARRQLLADVTHELRTPLTAIRGYAETLTLPAFAPASRQGREAVHVVDVEAQRLERLVNDLLDLARFDAAGAPLEVADVPVARLFTRVVERHGPGAAAAGLTLDTAVGPGAETVRGDERRLEQVLQNLTANALRHTPAGGRVALAAARDADALVFTVRDTGSGIHAEHLPYVFDRFYKADSARSDAGGTGLGLSIVKAIVERHDGAVRVTSSPGVETC
ncbi:MAG TPA: HAMP domain-containing sensor histidine kinase, partial [Vicinamibacterales bacterium]|nr:HAMP domain-containing sensor histidine kinase [Vicinamibacterales bacterium]